jgi:hypothetical protein
VAGDIRYVGKKTDRQWEEGEDLSVLEFKVNECGRSKWIIADEAFAAEVRDTGIREAMRLTRMSQHTIEKATNLQPIKRSTYQHILAAIASAKKR